MIPTSFLLLPSLILSTLLLTSLPSPAEDRKLSAKPPASSAGKSNAKRTDVVSFCQKNRGKKIGDGECWSLANEAFKQTGTQRPGKDLRVWGRLVNLKKESPQPGDILECDRTRFSDGSYTSAKHTAVIVGVHSGTMVRIAEQNFAGKRKVTERDLDLDGVRSGRIYVYRP
jgi:myosin tail region-interacting protein MTI1